MRRPASAPSRRSPNTPRGRRQAPAASLLLLAAHQLGFPGHGAIRWRGGGDAAHGHAGSRRHYRRRRHAPRTPLDQHHLGQREMRAAGDWLYMQAFKVALEERNLRVLDLLIGLTQQMVEGELLQIQKLGSPSPRRVLRPDLPQDGGVFSRVTMRLGAVLAGSTEEERRAWPPSAAPSVSPSRSSTTCSTLRPAKGAGQARGQPILREGKADAGRDHAADHGTAADRKAIRRVLDDRSFRECQPSADSRDSGAQTGLSNMRWPPPIAMPSSRARRWPRCPIRVQARIALGSGFVVAREK